MSFSQRGVRVVNKQKILALNEFEVFVLMASTDCILVSIFLLTKQSWISISSLTIPTRNYFGPMDTNWQCIAWRCGPAHISAPAISHCFNEKISDWSAHGSMALQQNGDLLEAIPRQWAEAKYCSFQIVCGLWREWSGAQLPSSVNNHQHSVTDAIQITFRSRHF